MLSVATTSENMPKLGETKLSIKSANGSVFLVDQNGDQVHGVTSVCVKSSVEDSTTIVIECYSHDVE